MKAIGGYFGLELNKRQINPHENAISLNTARNSLEYILLSKKYHKVYLPYFTCEVLLEPLLKNKINYSFYSVDINFEPVFDYSKIQTNEAFLYTNYFGLKDEFIKKLKNLSSNLIIDNAQSFYSLPEKFVDTFYSPRKFFGVSDGAYLYTDLKLDFPFEIDKSYERFSHLIKRLDLSAEEGYTDFSINDKSLENNPIRMMSNLTKAILSSIDYKYVAKVRQENFQLYHDFLSESNILDIKLNLKSVPLVYPYWPKKNNIRQKLLENIIYTAKYWPNVPKWTEVESLESKMFENIIYLPIDQRYSQKEIVMIINLINE